MTLIGWVQIGFLLALVLAAIKPLGLYMAKVFSGEKTFLTPVLKPLEIGIYKLSGIDRDREQGWLGYTLAMLAFSVAGFVVLYAIMRLQAYLPVNPQGFAAVPSDLAFNTSASFVTNTNWQNYSGEAVMSNFTQMAGLAVQNFLSAATGMALAIAVTRAFVRSSLSYGRFPVGLAGAFSPESVATLFKLNAFGAAALLAFIGLRYPSSR